MTVPGEIPRLPQACRNSGSAIAAAVFNLDCPLRNEVVFLMPKSDLRSFPSSFQRAGLACLVVLMCFSVVAQMLGTPITLVSLLADDPAMESLSENLSIPSAVLERGLASRPFLYEKTGPSQHYPIFEFRAFRPPKA